MKKITILGLLLISTTFYSQKKRKQQIDSFLLNSNKISFFDSTIFKSKNSKIDNPINYLTNKKVSKMPVYNAKGNFALKVFKVDTLKKHSLLIHKPD